MTNDNTDHYWGGPASTWDTETLAAWCADMHNAQSNARFRCDYTAWLDDCRELRRRNRSTEGTER